ncbi:putative entry exclusion protein TrbK-alt [Mesorhizobium carmichaelinearum]|uniref:putative entry exclusion protein TrbK-alt n=1 Tax=Mesorhizobium carmichaelinearum TaxID=1208188 RepID=UPI000BA424C5|nr:putative entry exclusion protein TrbK-alt [Mesorhizobium carmichaelinearum]
MDGRKLARLGAVGFVGIAIAATAIELSRKEDGSATTSIGRSEAASADPLRGELIRCQELGEAGTRDPKCLSAWVENRRRFLKPGARPVERLPDSPPPPIVEGPASEAAVRSPNKILRKEGAPTDEMSASPSTELPEAQ